MINYRPPAIIVAALFAWVIGWRLQPGDKRDFS
jgi:hypothetical protein